MKKGIGELEEGEVCPNADGSFLEKGYNISPLYTNGSILLVLFNKLGMVHCTYLGVSGYNF